jgi:multidrug efflux pump
LITLFLIPILYSRLARFTGSPDAVSRKLDAALGPDGTPTRPAAAE